MVDFAKLLEESRNMTPEKRAQRDAQREQEDAERERALAHRDAEERRSKIKHSRTITLTEDAEISFNRRGGREAYLIGTDEKNKPLKARYEMPYGQSREDGDALLKSLEKGTSAKLDGYFVPFKDREGTTHFTMAVMDLTSEHTKMAAQRAWDVTRTERQAAEDASAQQRRSNEQALWDVEIKRRNEAGDKAMVAFPDLVRNARDETYLAIAERREIAEAHDRAKTAAAIVLGEIMNNRKVPANFEHIPQSTMRDEKNQFLIIDLDAKRRVGNDPMDRDTQVRVVGFEKLGSDLYAKSLTGPSFGYGPVRPESTDTKLPDTQGVMMWDDLQRSAKEGRSKFAEESGQRNFVALPLSGPVADHPSMRVAAGFARGIESERSPEIQNLLRLDALLKEKNATIDLLQKNIIDTAYRTAAESGRTPYSDEATLAAREIAWSLATEKHTDALNVLTPKGDYQKGMAELNAMPLPHAVLAYVAAHGPKKWTQIMDLPEIHPSLEKSNARAPKVDLEIRGNRDIVDERRPDMKAATAFDAMRSGEKSALSSLARKESDGQAAERIAIAALKPGDIVRIHDTKLTEKPANGEKGRFVEVIVTGHPARLEAGKLDQDTLTEKARKEGMTDEAFKQRLEKRGALIQVPFKVIATSEIERPKVAAVARESARDGYQR